MATKGKVKGKMKRLVVISDMHCGHRSGLTPPAWQYKGDSGGSWDKWSDMQTRMWDWYAAEMKELQPIDVLVVNGDAIDGKGERAGSAEHVTADRKEQADMAVECIAVAQAKHIELIYGTPYHTGKEEDWEAVVADTCKAAIHDHLFLDANGTVFDFKHKIGSSSIPHGRATGPLKEKLWNMMWAERGLQPKANVIIRSHVHYFVTAGDMRGQVVITPALQSFGSKFGARQCSGTIDVGFLVFDCLPGGVYNMSVREFDLRPLATEALRV